MVSCGILLKCVFPRVLHGDSGGPLLYFKNFWSLVGVTSWTMNIKGTLERYAGFVSVKEALPWIEDTLREVDDLNCKPQGFEDPHAI